MDEAGKSETEKMKTRSKGSRIVPQYFTPTAAAISWSALPFHTRKDSISILRHKAGYPG